MFIVMAEKEIFDASPSPAFKFENPLWTGRESGIRKEDNP